jgi:MYXO-CTERM domain-containing protein
MSCASAGPCAAGRCPTLARAEVSCDVSAQFFHVFAFVCVRLQWTRRASELRQRLKEWHHPLPDAASRPPSAAAAAAIEPTPAASSASSAAPSGPTPELVALFGAVGVGAALLHRQPRLLCCVARTYRAWRRAFAYRRALAHALHARSRRALQALWQHWRTRTTQTRSVWLSTAVQYDLTHGAGRLLARAWWQWRQRATVQRKIRTLRHDRLQDAVNQWKQLVRRHKQERSWASSVERQRAKSKVDRVRQFVRTLRSVRMSYAERCAPLTDAYWVCFVCF